MSFRPSLVLLAGALALGSACSTSSSGEFAGDLYVEACSLGCTNGVSGQQVFCGIVSTLKNQELSVLFSEPLDLASVSSSSFRIIDTTGGTTPVGQYFLDPGDSRRLIFRPALLFDGNGSPTFGFEAGAVYEITIPGVAQGDSPPFVRSIAGRPNQSRLSCTINIGDGLLDPVPGPPTLELYLDRVVSFDATGEPTELDLVTDRSGLVPLFDGFGTDGLANNLANGGVEIVDVWRNSQIWFRFADIMNPATLANPTSQTSPTVKVLLDADGSVFTTNDQTPIAGSFVVHVDSELLETRMSFTPEEPLPSAGDPPLRLVIQAPDDLTDLVGLPLEAEGGGGQFTAIPEVVEFGPVTLAEDFEFGAGSPDSGEDAMESGADWGGGRLAPGFGGGTGRHGDLVVLSGQTVVLNTDSQDFPLPEQGGANTPNLIGNAFDEDMDVNTPDVFPTEQTVTDGVFEFTSLRVDFGGQLRFEGALPARLFVRGPAEIAEGAVLDLSGTQPTSHDSGILAPEAEAGPNPAPLPAGAGRGGFGGDRWDADEDFIALATGNNDAQANPEFVSLNGRSGLGLAGGANLGGGVGGAGNPTLEQYPIDTVMPGANGFGQWIPLSLTEVIESPGVPFCLSTRVGAPGAGGAYALDGSEGLGLSPSLDGMSMTDATPDWPQGASNNPLPTPGGSTSQIGLAAPNEQGNGYTVRTLNWFTAGALPYPGYLRGGSGGGGGGTHAYRALVGPNNFGNCVLNGQGGQASDVDEWHDHSGAPGGSGGGALQLVSGSRVVLSGQIDASGGEGGSPTAPAVLVGNFGRFAMPGGGGAGGAVRLQAPLVLVADSPERILIDGGPGGAGVWSNSSGGAGSPGLVRIEDGSGGFGNADYAPSISPIDPLDGLSLNWLSVAGGGAPDLPSLRPDALSAGVSCWIRPPGNYSRLTFQEDTGSGPDELGWDLDVLWMPSGQAEVAVPFRGPSPVPGFPDGFAAVHGNLLGGDSNLAPGSASPVVVRFQGARAGVLITDPCDVPLAGAGSPIVLGSLTPWVDHPALLNDFEPAPNMVRFVVIFDGTVDPDGGAMDTPGNVLESVRGVTNLRIQAQPQ